MKTTITLSVNTDNLRSVEDFHLHSLWHAAQMNPAPSHDADACTLVQDITQEIVRRWLGQAPSVMFEHVPGHQYWHTLVQHGSWRGPGHTWLPHDDASRADTITSTSPEA